MSEELKIILHLKTVYFLYLGYYVRVSENMVCFVYIHHNMGETEIKNVGRIHFQRDHKILVFDLRDK